MCKVPNDSLGELQKAVSPKDTWWKSHWKTHAPPILMGTESLMKGGQGESLGRCGNEVSGWLNNCPHGLLGSRDCEFHVPPWDIWDRVSSEVWSIVRSQWGGFTSKFLGRKIGEYVGSECWKTRTSFLGQTIGRRERPNDSEQKRGLQPLLLILLSV